jgi:hypothetical protein
MNMSNSRFFFMFFAILIGCENANKSNKTSRKWYYEDGALMKEQEYINDSIEHGTYRFFYPNGVLKDSAQLTFNKFHGKRFEYHENGKIHGLSSYFNNKYRNGITYRSDGTLEYYRACNYYEELKFIFYYDSLGKPIKYDGTPIYSWIQEKEYPLGKDFNIELLIASPPNCLVNVTISDWIVEKKQVLNKKTYHPDEFNRVTYRRKQFPNKDLFILHLVKIQDTFAKITFTDTLIIKVAKNGKSTNERGLH